MNVEEPWSELITFDEIQRLSQRALSEWGGSMSQPKEGCVESCLGAAYNAEIYTLADGTYKGLCFAGYLLYYLTRNHCYVDGNKRIGWLSSLLVLLHLGLTIEASDDEAEAFCLTIADEDLEDGGADAVRWLASRLVAIEHT